MVVEKKMYAKLSSVHGSSVLTVSDCTEVINLFAIFASVKLF